MSENNNTPTPADVEPPAQPATDKANESDQPKVDEIDWKAKAREWEKRAKDNKSAADRLAEIEEANKTEAQRQADKVAKAEAEVAQIPAKVAETLKSHLVSLHKISDEDAELFLTATDPELLLKQIGRLMERNEDGGKPRPPKPDPTQGRTPSGAPLDPRSADLAQIEADLKAAQSRR